MKFHKKWNFTRNIFQMGSQKRIHPKLSQIVFSRVKMMVNHRIWGIHSCSFPPKSGTISCQETRRWCFDRWGGSPFGCSLALSRWTTERHCPLDASESSDQSSMFSCHLHSKHSKHSWNFLDGVHLSHREHREPKTSKTQAVYSAKWCCGQALVLVPLIHGTHGFPSYSPVLAINWSTSPGLRTAIKSILIHLVHIVHNYTPLWSIMYHSYPFIRDKNPWFLRDFQILPWNHHTLEASHGIHGIHGREKLRPWTWEPLPLSLLVPRPWPRDFVE